MYSVDSKGGIAGFPHFLGASPLFLRPMGQHWRQIQVSGPILKLQGVTNDISLEL